MKLIKNKSSKKVQITKKRFEKIQKSEWNNHSPTGLILKTNTMQI